jgi:hypothetical protein
MFAEMRQEITALILFLILLFCHELPTRPVVLLSWILILPDVLLRILAVGMLIVLLVCWSNILFRLSRLDGHIIFLLLLVEMGTVPIGYLIVL